MSGTTYQRSDNINFPSGYDFTSGGTIVAPIYQLVKFGSSTTAGQVVACASQNDSIIGVLVNVPTSTNAPSNLATGPSPTTAEVHSINAQGTFKVQAGGTINAGNFITSNGSGYAVIATQTAGGSQPITRVFGQAITAAVASQIFEYQCMNFWY
jgi:hypothetical protein